MKRIAVAAAIAAAIALAPTANATPHGHAGPRNPAPANSGHVTKQQLDRLLFGPPQAPVPAPEIRVPANAPLWALITGSILDELVYQHPLPNHPWIIVVAPPVLPV